MRVVAASDTLGMVPVAVDIDDPQSVHAYGTAKTRSWQTGPRPRLPGSTVQLACGSMKSWSRMGCAATLHIPSTHLWLRRGTTVSQRMLD